MTYTFVSSLRGKLALVTGSSRGIGRAIALELARQGADIIVNYRLSTEAAAQTVAEIEALGRRAVALQANMREPDEINNLFKTISDRFGGLDILVLNAATGQRSKAAEMPIKFINLAISVNLLGPWVCVENAVPLMRARGGGRITAIVSSATSHVIKDYSATGTSKAALEALVRYLAVELAQENIVVNGVAPGIVQTEALEYWFSKEDIERWIERTPMKRMVRPEEVAYLVAFLCSERAAMICGEIIWIDGGYFLPV